MPRPCTICAHQLRLEIDKALIDAEPLRKLAARTGTSASALSRHCRHISETIDQARQSSDVAARNSAWARLQALERDTDEVAARARHAGNDALLMRAITRKEKQLALETLWARSPRPVRSLLGIEPNEPAVLFDYSRLSDEEVTQVQNLLRKAQGQGE